MADEREDEPTPVPEEEKEVLYHPAKGELQLTVRSVVAGCLLGGVVSAMNIYFGLKTGWAIGGSLIAAILGFAIFKALGPFLKTPYTRLEANITQTAGSGAGTMTSAAGLLSSIPAMGMLRAEREGIPDLGYLELTLWGISVAFLGIFFAIPLRKQMVVQEKLRFPTGTATAHTLMAMFAEGGDAMQKAKTLLLCSLGAGLFTLLTYFVPEAQLVPLHEWIPMTLIVWLAAISFKLYVSPLMFGAGILIGFRVAASLALGALFSWRFLGPWVTEMGWVEGPFMSYGSGARGWILWPGVAIMVADALTSLALSYPTIVRSFKFKRAGGEGGEGIGAAAAKDQQISWRVWAIGMSLASIATITMAWWIFDIAPWMSVVAIMLSSVLAMIATRSTGETDINPIGGMGKVTQLVFGGLAPGSLVTNLMSAAISSAGASQSGDMMQDLKTGYMLGAAPKRQLIAQIAGVVSGILFAVPIYLLFDAAYTIGEGDQMPAPAAHSWKAMAELLVDGFDALPMNAEYAIAAGFAFGVIVPLVRKFAPKGVQKYVPSGLAFGIAFIVPAFYSLSMFIGAVLFLGFQKARPNLAKNLGFAIASGLIAGEGLMGIVNAILTLLDVPTLTGGGGGH